MKKIYTILLLFSMGLVMLSVSCNKVEKEKTYVKKIELNDETIAVGIYKATGFEYPEFDYIAEALNIDGGIVYVSLTDADVLKTKLENIDVIIFPAIKKGQKIEILDDEIAEIFKKFTSIKGKGVIGICNGSCMLSTTPGCQTLNLVNMHIIDEPESGLQQGLIKFELTEYAKQIFPEFTDNSHSLYLNLNSSIDMKIVKDAANTPDLLGKTMVDGKSYPMFLSSEFGNGKILITSMHPETTPGMRWMIPRIVRWVFSKEFISYNEYTFRPELFNKEIILTQDLKDKIDGLEKILETGTVSEKLNSIDLLQGLYPWAGIEKVRALLNDKNDDIKIRSAKYLADNEYTLALNDLNLAIKKERSKKTREKLKEYRTVLENMLEQN